MLRVIKKIFKDSFKKLFDVVFFSSSFLLQSYYKRNHFKQEKSTRSELLNQHIHFLGVWMVLIGFYCLMVYLFGVKYEVSVQSRFLQLFSASPEKTGDEIYQALKNSLLVHGFFIYVFYRGITSNAERNFMRSHFLHHKLSGLIKVIKM
ncbi:MAG: hypothetical protein OXB84_06760, partial [Halobacteriovoraceae bacterium]|nr:hypothetical protein [Halobacteriovoraceae bacterium]